MSHGTTTTFADEIRAIPGGEHLEMCYSCGTCVSKCMIQQKVEPEYNPRRLLRLVMMGEREGAFHSPTTWLCSACDLCYPACPQQIHISGVINAVKQKAIEAGVPSPLEAVQVDENLCSGCGICVMVCPYEAPHLIEKETKNGVDIISESDPNRCMRCGTCVAACPMGAISRKGISNDDLKKQFLPKKQVKTSFKMITFICDWCLRETSDLEILESYSPEVKVVHIPCSGRIDPQLALLALRSGIEKVLVCGCKPGECHFKRGTYLGTCKLGKLDEMFSQIGIKNEGVRFVQIGTQERGRIRHEIDRMLVGEPAYVEVK
jgi:coenzyme F420-reducing hydrogenase delta subunit/heterodisulfide reductase subunit C